MNFLRVFGRGFWALAVVVLVYSCCVVVLFVNNKRVVASLNEKNVELNQQLDFEREQYEQQRRAFEDFIANISGEEEGFVPMFESVERAEKFEFIVYSDETESGEARKFTFNCEGKP